MLADQEGVSKHEAAIRAIRFSAEQLSRESAVDAAIDRGLERWGAVLERLGQ